MIEIGIELFFTIILIFFPNKYFDRNIYFSNHETSDNKEKESFNHASVFIADDQSADKDNQIKKQDSLCSSVFCNINLLLIIMVRSTQLFVYINIFFWYTDYIEFTITCY